MVGDQGIMFGYACDETDNFMPAPIDYSHKILKTLANYRHNNDSFGPDSKVKLVCFTKITDQKTLVLLLYLVSTQSQLIMMKLEKFWDYRGGHPKCNNSLREKDFN